MSDENTPNPSATEAPSEPVAPDEAGTPSGSPFAVELPEPVEGGDYYFTKDAGTPGETRESGSSDE